jgi:hypothetical protein
MERAILRVCIHVQKQLQTVLCYSYSYIYRMIYKTQLYIYVTDPAVFMLTIDKLQMAWGGQPSPPPKKNSGRARKVDRPKYWSHLLL